MAAECRVDFDMAAGVVRHLTGEEILAFAVLMAIVLRKKVPLNKTAGLALFAGRRRAIK